MTTTNSDLLTSTVCVVRAKAPELLALDHVAQLVDALQDEASTLPCLTQAAASGSMRWFDRVYQRCAAPPTQEELAVDDGVLEHYLGQAMVAAVANGHMEIVQKIHALHPHRLPVQLLPAAAGNGDLFMLQWLLAHRSDGLCTPGAGDESDGRIKSDASIDAAVAAAGTGSGDELHLCCLAGAYERALEKNQFQIVKWLREKGFDDSRCEEKATAGDAAASAGDLEMVQWLHVKEVRGTFSTQAIDGAAKGGHLEVVQFLLANRNEGFTSAAIHNVIVGGYNEIEQVFRTSKKLNDEAFQALGKFGPEAAALGRLDLLQSDDRYVMKESRDQQRAIVSACTGGHLEVVQWLMDHYKIQCDAAAVTAAASQGRLNVLEWIHQRFQQPESGAWWTVDAMDRAAENGQLTTVQWLNANRTEGCSSKAMNRAAANGHLQVVQWLHENRTEGCTTDAMDHAARNGHFEMVLWLHENRTEGCTKEAMNFATPSILKWLHFNRSEGCTSDAMDRAAELGDLLTCEFLRTHRTEGCFVYAAAVAKSNGHEYMVEWLRKWYPIMFDEDLVYGEFEDEYGETNPHCMGMGRWDSDDSDDSDDDDDDDEGDDDEEEKEEEEAEKNEATRG